MARWTTTIVSHADAKFGVGASRALSVSLPAFIQETVSDGPSQTTQAF